MQISRRQTDGMVLQIGSSIGDMSGCDLLDVDSATAQNIELASNNPLVACVFLVNVSTIDGMSSGAVEVTQIPTPPAPNPDVSDYDTNYDLAVTRLQQIIAASGTLTAAQAQAAIIDLARIQLRVLKFIRARVGQ